MGAAIGALGSIFGSWVAVRYQLVGTARVTRAIRREEREEAALLEVVRLLGPIRKVVMGMQVSYEVDPGGTHPESFQAAIQQAVDGLAARWGDDLSAQALNAGIDPHILRIRVAAIEPHSPWDKNDRELWESMDKMLREARAIEARIRDILGTSRPKRPPAPAAELGQDGKEPVP